MPAWCFLRFFVDTGESGFLVGIPTRLTGLLAIDIGDPESLLDGRGKKGGPFLPSRIVSQLYACVHKLRSEKK